MRPLAGVAVAGAGPGVVDTVAAKVELGVGPFDLGSGQLIASPPKRPLSDDLGLESISHRLK